jgi:ribosomal protein S8
VLGIIKQNIASKKRYFKVLATPSVLELFYCFYRLGYCSGARRCGNELIISLNYVNGVPSLRQLKIIAKPSHKRTFTLKRKFQEQSLYIMSTGKGIISNQEAALYGIGGIALACCN